MASKVTNVDFNWKHEYEMPFLDNFCPYFWLTIFCVISPLAVIFHSLVFLFQKCVVVIDFLGEMFDKFVCSPLYDCIVVAMGEDEVHQCYTSHNSKKKKRFGRFKAIKRQNLSEEEWESFMKELEERCKKRKEDIAKREEKEALKKKDRDKNRRALFNKLIKYTKFVTPVLIAILAAVVGYLIYLGGGAFYGWINQDKLMSFLQGLIVLIVICTAGCTLVGEFYFVVKLFKKCDLNIKCPKFVKSFFGGMVSGIGGFLNFSLVFSKPTKKITVLLLNGKTKRINKTKGVVL